MYFFEDATSWGDITDKVRDKLITSATTQINRSNVKYRLSDEIKVAAPKVYLQLSDCIQRLGKVRLEKGGKKSYDLMVAGYFNDLFLQLKDSYRVLKKDTMASYVLGDSAPYGIHIATDTLLGELAVAVGFKNYDIEVLRKRGDKWKSNPQRHSVALRESVLTLTKE